MDEPEMKIIDVFICKLRKKLALAGAGNLIGTVWGRGYMIREPMTDPIPVVREKTADIALSAA
jgi:two-component system cell cycle response regulator CtrA